MAKLTLVNPTDKDWSKHRYILCFGAYGDTHLMAYANSLDDALDECVDWIVDFAPGLLCDDAVNETYVTELARLKAEGLSDDEATEKAQELAEVDTTCAGNCGHYLLSYEWGIVAEDPERTLIKSYETVVYDANA